MRRFHFPLGYAVLVGLVFMAGFLTYAGLHADTEVGFEPVDDEAVVVVSRDEGLDRVAAHPVLEQTFEEKFGDKFPWGTRLRRRALATFRDACRSYAAEQFRAEDWPENTIGPRALETSEVVAERSRKLMTAIRFWARPDDLVVRPSPTGHGNYRD